MSFVSEFTIAIKTVCTKLKGQIVGFPMGTNCAALVSDLVFKVKR